MDFCMKNACTWELMKAGFLLQIAGDLGMDLNGYGELAVNPTSGNVYLWLEDYPFTLFMPINCELTRKHVWALYTDLDSGEETEIQLNNKRLNELDEWVDGIIDEA